jgi:hypothetical protein
LAGVTILAKGVLMMNTRMVIEGVVLALVVITAVSLLPDFIRYMKIRSM